MTTSEMPSSESSAVAMVETLLQAIAERDAKLAERDAKLAERTGTIAQLRANYEGLQKAYALLQQELLLVKRRIFIASAERVDTSQLQLEFEELTKKLDDLAGQLPDSGEVSSDAGSESTGQGGGGGAGGGDREGKRGRGSARGRGGRRNLADSDLPEESATLTDPVMEELVEQGKAERISAQTSYQLMYRPGTFLKLAIHRTVYRTVNAQGTAELETTPIPPTLLPRCLATPSTLANIAESKFDDGLPLYRKQQALAREGASIDRGTMCRWMEELGGAFGATVVAAMDSDARANAFCIATDATGFAIQPGPREGGPRRSCRKGHYFVRIADRDHILFDFTERHTTKAVRAMFKGYEGYVQADACSVYDALFRPAKPGDPDDDGCLRKEVGCWSHLRRKHWEAALSKAPLAREALLRLHKIFEVDASFFKNGRPPPSKVKKLREKHLRPLIEEFLHFSKVEFERLQEQRSPLQRALGYAVRQADALRRVLEDGRLRLDNNPSEGQLRKVVRIRDAALFAGSNDHAESAGHILSLIASAKLHNLNPERYLRDLIRVLPFWPRERYLELAPKFWTQTRARLDAAELDAEVGWITVPEPPPNAAH